MKSKNPLPETKPIEAPSTSPVEHEKGIYNHKKAAIHFAAAAKSHLNAAKHHEEGNHDQAATCTVEALGHAYLGNEAQKDDVKNHSLKV